MSFLSVDSSCWGFLSGQLQCLFSRFISALPPWIQLPSHTTILAKQRHCRHDRNETPSTGTIFPKWLQNKVIGTDLFLPWSSEKPHPSSLCSTYKFHAFPPQCTLGRFLTILNVYNKNNLTITIFKISVLWCENFDWFGKVENFIFCFVLE